MARQAKTRGTASGAMSARGENGIPAARLLIVYHSQTGHTRSMARAVLRGARRVPEVETRMKMALYAGLDDLLRARGLLLGTPENFGYMSGALKNFLDRTYYPAQGKISGLPYADRKSVV